jgi:hypothetical protein
MSGAASTEGGAQAVSGDNQLVAARAGGREIRRQIGPHRLVESHPPHVDVSEIGYRPIACRVDIEVLQPLCLRLGTADCDECCLGRSVLADQAEHRGDAGDRLNE